MRFLQNPLREFANQISTFRIAIRNPMAITSSEKKITTKQITHNTFRHDINRPSEQVEALKLQSGQFSNQKRKSTHSQGV